MRPSKYDNLRWCDRLKSSIVYNQVEAFGKKFRKKKDHENEIINANAQQRQIDAFYKVGWEYQHAHSSYSTDISDPIYIQQKPDQAKDEDLTQFYNTCKNGIQRLKCQHEDETVFRIQARWSRPICSISKEDWQSDKYSKQQKKMYQNVICAKETYRNFIVNFERFVHSMINNIENDIDVEGQSEYSKVLQIYQIISGWLQYYKGGDEQDKFETQQWLQQQSDEVISIHHYISNFISIAEQVRSEKKSAVFNIQPMIDALTLIIHPTLLGLFGLYHKEQIIWSNQYQHNVLNIDFDRKINKGSLLEDVKHGEISRTVFLNFDGYESQFNIEFAKNMSNHLLYISFPIFNKPPQPHHSPFNIRFLKKVLFNHCRELYELHNDQHQTIKSSPQIEDCEYNQILKQLQRNFNQQNYFHECQKLYSNKCIAEGNNNIYILPVIFPYLQEEFKNLFVGGDGEGPCQLWVSSFVWFMMDSFVMADIARYNPDRIVVSYSGLVNLSEPHFVRIMQQLAVISKRRIIFCPNFTTKFTQKLKQDYNYDNYVITSQQFLTPEVLLPKLSQFLKISSGTYNLNPPPLTQNILSKYKQLKLNNYIKGLLTALSNQQFAHLKNRISDMLLRVDGIVLNRAVKDVELELTASIPAFYKQLFAYIRTILLYPYSQAKYERGVAEQVLKIKRVLDKIGRVGDRQAFVADMIRGLELAIVQQKYSNYAYVYYKCKLDKVEYAQLKQQISQTTSTSKQPPKRTQNSLQGLYTLQLKHTTAKKQKLCLPICSTTELLYRQNQTYKMRRMGKKTANIMFMNNLQQNEYRCYAGLVNLIQLHESDRNKHKIPMQRVEMYQVVFNGMGEVGGWKVRGHWNYAETNRYYILYWPSLCDVLELKLKQINDDIYEPTLLNQIYVCQIPTTKQHKLIFNRANPTNQDTIPRKHCNSLCLDEQDKIFILGGFYQKQHNYLSLQTQITGLDLSHYNDTNFKCIITNQKGTLYTDINQKNTTNSYVRARAEYEIFQLEEVCDIDDDVDVDVGEHVGQRQGQRQGNQRVKRFVMIGGFGQDFVRPYSLLSCNYYQFAVDKQQKKIISISRKQVYQKILTCNIRGYIKNNGYYERLAYYDRNILKSNEALSKDDYIAHRSVYSLQKQLSHGSVRYELHCKLKYLFGFNPYNQYKLAYVKLAAKIGQRVDSQTNESSQFLLMISPQGNNYLTIWKSKNDEQQVQIYLEKMQSKSKYQKVALTHGTIISIDLKFQHIYALIKHQLYTSGKYVLAESQIVSEQSEILLKVVKEFSHNLQQYWLFTPRPTEVLLLHGISFLNVNVQDFSYRVSKKQGSKQEPVKKIDFPDRIDPEMYRKCLTIMTKNEDNETKTPQILSTNLQFRRQDDPTITMTQHQLKMSSHNPNFRWERVSRSRIQLREQNSDKATTIIKILQIRQIEQQSQHQHNLPLVTNTSILNEINKSLQPIFLIRFHGACRKEYVWIVNCCSLAADGQELKFVVFVSANQDAKAMWELATPLKFHIKTINKYKDMEIL